MAQSSSSGKKNNNFKRDLRTTLFNMPKIDLHRHLEGSLRLSTLAEIAHEHGVDLPSYSLEELRPYVQVVDDPRIFTVFWQNSSYCAAFTPSEKPLSGLPTRP